jgi:hypothetical protein
MLYQSHEIASPDSQGFYFPWDPLAEVALASPAAATFSPDFSPGESNRDRKGVEKGRVLRHNCVIEA